MTYTYDPAGNRVRREDSGTVTTYSYDITNRLESEADVSGLTAEYLHDADGNRIRKYTASSMTYYEWDEDNQLVLAEPVSGPVELTYNAEGRRVKKETPSEVKNFIYDFQRLLQETDDAGDVEHQYTFTNKEYGDLVSEYDGLETAYHQHDAIGTTDALLDDNETATDRYAHRAFGLQESHTGTSNTPFTFVGQKNYYRDSELDLYLAGARYYDPQAGRWISKDPIGLHSGDTNLYRYVENNPVHAADPSGLHENMESSASDAASPVAEAIRQWEMINMLTGRYQQNGLLQWHDTRTGIPVQGHPYFKEQTELRQQRIVEAIGRNAGTVGPYANPWLDPRVGYKIRDAAIDRLKQIAYELHLKSIYNDLANSPQKIINNDLPLLESFLSGEKGFEAHLDERLDLLEEGVRQRLTTPEGIGETTTDAAAFWLSRKLQPGKASQSVQGDVGRAPGPNLISGRSTARSGRTSGIPQYDTPFQPLTKSQRTTLKAKLDARTITKQEFSHLEWDRRFANRRTTGGVALKKCSPRVALGVSPVPGQLRFTNSVCPTRSVQPTENLLALGRSKV